MNKSEKLETFFTINRLISQTTDWKPALDEIIYLVHPLLDCDTFFIHQIDEPLLSSTLIINAKSMNSRDLFDSQFNWEGTLAYIIIHAQ